MANNGFYIKNPLNNKNITVSRDIYHALEASMKLNAETARKQQEEQTKQIKEINQYIQEKTYVKQTSGLKMAINFNENGQIREETHLVNLMGKLANLPEDVTKIVQSALEQYMITINEALLEKTEDSQSKIEELKAQIEAAAQNAA